MFKSLLFNVLRWFIVGSILLDAGKRGGFKRLLFVPFLFSSVFEDTKKGAIQRVWAHFGGTRGMEGLVSSGRRAPEEVGHSKTPKNRASARQIDPPPLEKKVVSVWRPFS